MISKTAHARLRYIFAITEIIFLTSFKQYFENFVFLGKKRKTRIIGGKPMGFHVRSSLNKQGIILDNSSVVFDWLRNVGNK